MIKFPKALITTGRALPVVRREEALLVDLLYVHGIHIAPQEPCGFNVLGPSAGCSENQRGPVEVILLRGMLLKERFNSAREVRIYLKTVVSPRAVLLCSKEYVIAFLSIKAPD